MDPGLAVVLAHEFDLHAADAVGEVVIAGGLDRVGFVAEAQLGDAGQEFLVMLAAEQAQGEFPRIGRPPLQRDAKQQAGEQPVIQQGNSLPARELGSVDRRGL